MNKKFICLRIFKTFMFLLNRVRFLLLILAWVSDFFSFLRAILFLAINEGKKVKFGSCGDNVVLHGKLTVHCPSLLNVSGNVHINTNAFLRCEGGLSIGENTHISRNLTVYTANHNYKGDKLPYDHTLIKKAVSIGENVWIGMNVCILPGVTIGEGAIIGMGAVVSSDVEPLAIVGGNPARIIKYRDREHYLQLKQSGKISGASGF